MAPGARDTSIRTSVRVEFSDRDPCSLEKRPSERRGEWTADSQLPILQELAALRPGPSVRPASSPLLDLANWSKGGHLTGASQPDSSCQGFELFTREDSR